MFCKALQKLDTELTWCESYLQWLFSFLFRIVEDNPIFSLIESKAPSSEQQNTTNVSMATRSAVSAPTTPVSTTVKFVTEKPPIPGRSTSFKMYLCLLSTH